MSPGPRSTGPRRSATEEFEDEVADSVESSAASPGRRSWRDPKRLAIQLLGFAAGIALLAFCIHGAWPRDEAAREGWMTLRAASPWLLVGIFGCTLASSVVNALSFQVTGRTLGSVNGWDLQRLNLVANLLNYAPVRLGLVARVGWHLTVDRFRIIQIGGWLAVVGLVLLISVGAAMTATLARPDLDLIWLLLLVGQIVAGIFMLRWVGSVLLRRHGRDVERVLRAPGVLWAAAALRLADVAAYWGRMWLAAAMLGLDFSAGQLLMLAIVAYAGSLAPFGRVGFREFLVAAAAAWIGLDEAELDARMAQLALLESAGEFAFYFVTGAVMLPWYRRRMARAAAARRAEAATEEDPRR